jgi:cell division protein FtsB
MTRPPVDKLPAPPLLPGRLLRSRRVLLVNAVLFALMVWGLGGEWLRTRDLVRDVQVKQAAAAELDAELAVEERHAAQVAEGFLAEREARLKLGLRRPGERVAVILGEPAEGAAVSVGRDGDGTASAAAGGLASPDSNALGWWHYFFP